MNPTPLSSITTLKIRQELFTKKEDNMRAISTVEVSSLMVLEPQGTPIIASMRVSGKMEISTAKVSSPGPTDPSTMASTITAKNTEEEHSPIPQEKPTWDNGVTANKKEKEPSQTVIPI